MVVQAGYPGVYIQEIPSGVRTIIGASTSNLAIIGQFARGPANDEAIRVNRWSDVERFFGGVDRRSEASYALQEFFQQGGSTAYVVRVAFAQAEVTLTTTEPALTLTAKPGGAAGNDVAVGFSANPDGSFDMIVSPSAANHAQSEVLTNLSATPGSPNFVEARVNAPVAAGGSALVTVSGAAYVPLATAPGSAVTFGRGLLTPLAGGGAAISASLDLPSTAVPALVATAVAPGSAGNAMRIALRHIGADEFELLVRPDAVSTPELFGPLSMIAGATNVVTVVNAPVGGSALLTIADVSGASDVRPAEVMPVVLPAGFTAASPLTDIGYDAMRPLAGGVDPGVSATIDLPAAPAVPALVATAAAAGGAGNAVRIALRHVGGSNFELLVRPNAAAAPELFSPLSMTAGVTNVVTVVNAPAGGSALLSITDISGVSDARPAEVLPAVPPAGFNAASPLTDIGYDAMRPLAGGVDGATATLRPSSELLPALTLQAMAGGAAGNLITAEVTANNPDGTFNLAFGGPNPATLTNLSIDPTIPDYVVSRAAAGQAGVVIGRHPLRRPSVAGPQAFAGGGAAVPSARATLNTAAATPAFSVVAGNPGAWGNSLRVGAGTAAGGGFDLIVAEYRGDDRFASEVFRGLNTIVGDPHNAVEAVRTHSELIRIEGLAGIPAPSIAGVDVDELTRGQLTPLAGGADGVMPGDPAWTGSAVTAFRGSQLDRTGLYAFDRIAPEVFNIMAVPEAPLMSDGGAAVYAAAATYCDANLAFLLVDHPLANDSATRITDWDIAGRLGTNLARSAALCFPKVLLPDPLAGNRKRALPSSGSIAGVMARIDGQRGVWKAPAGLDASLAGAEPSVTLTDLEQGRLNKRGLNCLRKFPNVGTVHWGARTLAGADTLASEWKYVPVRRMALFIEQSLKMALPWVVFEPNDEPLWSQIRLNVGSFMHSLFVQGAFEGGSAREAYLVRCDASTTSQQDINSGIVNILVGFAPLKPAEFVVVRLRQLAGQLAA